MFDDGLFFSLEDDFINALESGLHLKTVASSFQAMLGDSWREDGLEIVSNMSPKLATNFKKIANTSVEEDV